MRVCVCFLLVVVHISFLFNGQALADDTVDFHSLNKKADMALRLVQEERYEEGKQVLNWIGDRLPEMDYEKEDLNSRDMGTLIRAYEGAQEGVTAADLPPEERVRHLLTFRLALDSVISRENPLWKKTEPTLQEKLKEVYQHAVNQEEQEAQRVFNEWLRQFEIIRPAFTIREEPAVYERVSSYVKFMDQNRREWLQEDGGEHLEKLEKEMKSLFHPENRDSAIDPSLLWVMISVGGMVILSLTYAGWKKYKGEKGREKMKQ
ncbi:sporulation protein YpjB [Thalassorhabdus alkalitolerans]|uniref:Sporulation protein YpjB n=1 Tax=Thalassorhabdus alkalitolerans TaxID=2282697 RepID=A0ABW0YQ34_9BACI|nr:sporulation protein YpjB [Thalassobacillus sp. C254]